MSDPRQFFWRAMQRLNLVKPKKRQFQVFTDLFLARLRAAPAVRSSGASRGAVGVLVTPWQQTAVPKRRKSNPVRRREHNRIYHLVGVQRTGKAGAGTS